MLAGVFRDVVSGLRLSQDRPRYDARRTGVRPGFCTLSLDKELGALTCAPSSTPTPSRSTSSPPNQPATTAITTAAKERARASPVGVAGSGRRSIQLPAKSSTTKTFKPPCHNPTALARVLLGIPIQSISPNTAAKSPPRIPAPIMYHAIVDHFPSDVLSVMMSKITEVASKPKGNTMSIGCTGCPAIFICPPKQYPECDNSQCRWVNDVPMLAQGDSFDTDRMAKPEEMSELMGWPRSIRSGKSEWR